MMKYLVSAMFLVGAGGSALAAEPGFKEITAGKMSFQWKIDGKKLSGILTAPAAGWVGIGFHPTDGMKDASYVIGAADKDKWKVENHYGTSKSKHEKNADLGCKEVVENGAAEDKDGKTTIRFTIPLDFEDKCTKPIAVDKDVPIILAYSNRDSFKTKHPEVFVGSLNLTSAKFAQKGK